jgi:hypothetical protein
MPRKETITVNGKLVTVKEYRVKELEALFNNNKNILDGVISANSTGDVLAAAKGVLYEKIPEIFPELTADDIGDAYPSEIEELIQKFVDVNFFGIKRLAGPLIKIITNGLARA